MYTNRIAYGNFAVIRTFQINVDPESLKPKRPNLKDLKPYPVTCYIEYKGHNDAVTSISTESSGQWIASGIHIFLFCLQAVQCFGKYADKSLFFLLRKKVQLMELYGFGRLQPVDVSVSGILVLLSDKWHGILYQSSRSWQSLCKHHCIVCYISFRSFGSH